MRRLTLRFESAYRSNWKPRAGATEAAMTAAEMIVVDRIVVR